MMMDEGEPEVHTTELTALSAAEKNVMEDELTTTTLTTNDVLDLVMEVQPGLAHNPEAELEITIENHVNLGRLQRNDQQELQQNERQQQNQQPLQQDHQQPFQSTAIFQPFFKTISADPSFLPSSYNESRAFFSPSLTTAPTSVAESSSLLSSLPDSSSTRSSLDFTAAWVASTPFSAATKPSHDSAPLENDREGGGGDGADIPAPHFVVSRHPVLTTTTTTSKTARATMVGSLSGRKIRPATTMMMGMAQQQQRLQHFSSRVEGNVDHSIQAQRTNPPQILPSNQPQFITPTFSVSRYPLSGPTVTNNSSNNSSAVGFIPPTTTPFFVPTVGGANTSVDYPVRNLPIYDSTATSNHLGRHWKQMGCQTRQYVQPSIPLPASIRLASAAKQLRVGGKGGATSLGGPPGSLSPLTPNKSWAQVVASSTPQQKKPPLHPQQKTTTINAESGNSTAPLFALQHKQHPKGVVPNPGMSYSKVAAAMPPPAIFPGNGGGGKPTKSASLRGLAGLGGVSTSSNRDFKSLLLRLKTALDKEKAKWRPKAFASSFGGIDGGKGSDVSDAASPTGKSVKSNRETIDGKGRDECIFWLAWIVRKLQFSAETMALSMALFDALITSSIVGKTEVSPSFVVTAGNGKLVALVCLLLSAKFSEEDADVPTTKDFLSISEINNGVTSNGLVTVEMSLKMERVILTALEWDLNRPTPLKFLEILHTLLLCHQPQLLEDVALNLTPAKHLQRLTWKMQKIVANHQLALSYRPAVLAVSLLSIDLESIGVSDWQVVSNALEKICQIGHSSNEAEDRHKISRCKNLIIRLLAGGDRTDVSIKNARGGADGTLAAQATEVGGGGGERGQTKNDEDPMKEKRSMVKLKRKHVPSESCGGGGNGMSGEGKGPSGGCSGGGGGFAESVDMACGMSLNSSSTCSATTFSSKASSASSTSSSKTTLKRVFNIAESPTCKSEARSEEAAVARGGFSAAGRFQALQGLCINIY